MKKIHNLPLQAFNRRSLLRDRISFVKKFESFKLSQHLPLNNC